MKCYLLTSKLFDGEIEFIFDDDGSLCSYDNRANLNQEQKIWLLNKLPRSIEQLKGVLGSSQSAKLTEVKKEVSFDAFWDLYDDKKSSSRKRTLAKWDKLKKSDKIKAFNYVPFYFTTIPSGTRKKFAETYLNAELWNN